MKKEEKYGKLMLNVWIGRQSQEVRNYAR